MRRFISSATIAAIAIVLGLSYLDAGSTLLKKEEIPKTIQLLKSGSAKDRAYAAEQLGHRGAVRSIDVVDAIDPLMSALKSDMDVNVRKAAAEALGSIGRELETTVPMLVDTMKMDKSEMVKVAAINALAQIGPEARSAVPEIRKVMNDTDKKNKVHQAAKAALKSLSRK